MGEWEMMVGYCNITLEVNGTVTCNRHLCGILYTIH